MKLILTFSILLLYCAHSTHAQHQHMKNMDNKKMSDTSKAQPPIMLHQHNMPDTGHQMDMEGLMMSSQLSKNLPMSRNGSGSSWHPDNSPVYAIMQHGKSEKAWKYMYMGNLYLRYTNQDFTKQGNRGGAQFDAPNWFMAMAQKPIGKNGLLGINAMLSLDALTVTPGGYPLLFQSGESYKGTSLVDRQHPHDLFANLSLSYAHALNKNVDIYTVVGYPTEPVIGPPVFMHRLSAFNLADAGIGHHWQDATHIAFGVATVGVRYKKVKVEGSSFTGREPDEFRYNFDPLHLDSWAWRISYNPSPSIAMQFSQANIHSPEKLNPEENVFRQTASIIHTKPLNKTSYIATTAVWGLNQQSGSHISNNHSALLESNLQYNKWAFFGRTEWVQKLSSELNISLPDDRKLQFTTLSVGTNRIMATSYKCDLRLGAVFTTNLPDAQVKALYGNLPLSFQVYAKITPTRLFM